MPKSSVKTDTEAYMDAEMRAFFVAHLTAQKDEMLRESLRTRDRLQNERIVSPDLNDCATLEEEFSLELRTRDRERKLLQKIDRALERLARNEFGWCARCGEEIGILRLKARPTAELCIDCKEIAERHEKNYYEGE